MLSKKGLSVTQTFLSLWIILLLGCYLALEYMGVDWFETLALINFKPVQKAGGFPNAYSTFPLCWADRWALCLACMCSGIKPEKPRFNLFWH
jgi:hypothetical protein